MADERHQSAYYETEEQFPSFHEDADETDNSENLFQSLPFSGEPQFPPESFSPPSIAAEPSPNYSSFEQDFQDYYFSDFDSESEDETENNFQQTPNRPSTPITPRQNLPLNPILVAGKKKLISLEREWWNMTSYRFRLEQLAQSIDEDYLKEKCALERLENRSYKHSKEVKIPPNQLSKHLLLTLIQFAKTDSLRKASIALEQRLKVLRTECDTLERRKNLVKNKVNELIEEEEESLQNNETQIQDEQNSQEEGATENGSTSVLQEGQNEESLNI